MKASESAKNPEANLSEAERRPRQDRDRRNDSEKLRRNDSEKLPCGLAARVAFGVDVAARTRGCGENDVGISREDDQVVLMDRQRQNLELVGDLCPTRR